MKGLRYSKIRIKDQKLNINIIKIVEVLWKREIKTSTIDFVFKVTTFFWELFRIRFRLFFMQKNLDENSYEKRIENIEQGKSYLKSNRFFRSKSKLFENIQKLIYKK